MYRTTRYLARTWASVMTGAAVMVTRRKVERSQSGIVPIWGVWGIRRVNREQKQRNQ